MSGFEKGKLILLVTLKPLENATRLGPIFQPRLQEPIACSNMLYALLEFACSKKF